MAVQDSAARSQLVGHLRAIGCTADDFAGSRQARDLIAASLSRYEDVLELTRGALAASERARVRVVRRGLETEAD